jgi:dUTP pyrophosphatase
MLLNSKQLTQFVKESEYSKKTQIGIDLSVKSIQKIVTKSIVYTDGTHIDPSGYIDIPLVKIDNKECWNLEPGVYSVTFNEGVTIPDNCAAIITHRSSLYRTGTSINSPWWDPGFYCDNMNTTMITNNGIIIEKNARLAQIAFWECSQVEETYNGQWQGLSTAHK